MPEQFCTPMEGISNGTPLYANAYPVAWRVVIVDNELYRGFEYVRSVLDATRHPGVVR